MPSLGRPWRKPKEVVKKTALLRPNWAIFCGPLYPLAMAGNVIHNSADMLHLHF